MDFFKLNIEELEKLRESKKAQCQESLDFYENSKISYKEMCIVYITQQYDFLFSIVDSRIEMKKAEIEFEKKYNDIKS